MRKLHLRGPVLLPKLAMMVMMGRQMIPVLAKALRHVLVPLGLLTQIRVAWT
jgi:hypothetical protein